MAYEKIKFQIPATVQDDEIGTLAAITKAVLPNHEPFEAHCRIEGNRLMVSFEIPIPPKVEEMLL